MIFKAVKYEICGLFLRERHHSQLQDQDDLRLVLEDFVQRDDVRVLDLLQDVHLALDVLPRHPASTRLAAPLLDEFGGVFHPGAPVPTSSDHGKLTATRGEGEGERKSFVSMCIRSFTGSHFFFSHTTFGVVSISVNVVDTHTQTHTGLSHRSGRDYKA